MSPLETVLMQLDRPRAAGKGYTARCPAHDDRGPSLSVTEGDDGRVLIHCFAGCATADVLAAIGLTVNDLFATTRQHRPVAPGVSRTALRAAAEFESQVLAIIKLDRAKGRQISTVDLQRERIAKQRLQLARKALA